MLEGHHRRLYRRRSLVISVVSGVKLVILGVYKDKSWIRIPVEVLFT